MATIPYEVDQNFSELARYTAVGQTEIRVTNPSGGSNQPLRWTVSMDDTIPAVSPNVCPEIASGGHDNITLQDGERIWFAATSVFDISVTL